MERVYKTFNEIKLIKLKINISSANSTKNIFGEYFPEGEKKPVMKNCVLNEKRNRVMRGNGSLPKVRY